MTACWVTLVDDGGEMDVDAQVFLTEENAQAYAVEVVLDYLKLNDLLDCRYDEESDLRWSDAIAQADDTATAYTLAHDFLNDWAIEDLGVLVLPRHIYGKVGAG